MKVLAIKFLLNGMVEKEFVMFINAKLLKEIQNTELAGEQLEDLMEIMD